MHPKIRDDILSVLRKSIPAFTHKRLDELVSLSNQTIHNASIYQDADSSDIAVTIYALSKLVGRKALESTKNQTKILGLLEKAYTLLQAHQDAGFRDVMQKIYIVIHALDRGLSSYVDHVVNHARLKKSAKIYDHGISLAQSASSLGVSQWQLYEYLGKTRMDDSETASISNMKKRLAYARLLFTNHDKSTHI